MIACIKSLRKVNKDTYVNLTLSKFWAKSRVNCNLACSVELFIWKPNWFLWRGIIHEIFVQTIIHNTFKHFGKNWKIKIGRQFSTSSLWLFFATGITFAILRFSWKTASRDASQISKKMILIESQTFRIKSPLIPSQSIALFPLSTLNVFSNSSKESYLCSIEALHEDKYSLTFLETTGILIASIVLTLMKCLLISRALPRNFGKMKNDVSVPNPAGIHEGLWDPWESSWVKP